MEGEGRREEGGGRREEGGGVQTQAHGSRPMPMPWRSGHAFRRLHGFAWHTGTRRGTGAGSGGKGGAGEPSTGHPGIPGSWSVPLFRFTPAGVP